MAHVCRLGTGNVSSTVTAGVTQVAVGALRKTWELKKVERGGVNSSVSAGETNKPGIQIPHL